MRYTVTDNVSGTDCYNDRVFASDLYIVQAPEGNSKSEHLFNTELLKQYSFIVYNVLSTEDLETNRVTIDICCSCVSEVWCDVS